MFQELVRFHARFGHCRVVEKWKENPGLGKWVVRQRQAHAHHTLRPDRQARLDALGFAWRLGRGARGDELWERQFAALVAFQAVTGHTRVTRAPPGSVKLWSWRHIQRAWRRKGLLKPERIARLDALGFEWDEPGRAAASREERWDAQWERRYQELLAFHRRFGHCRVPTGWPENRPLAKWVGVQRRHHQRGELRADRRARLDALGFVWRVGKSGQYHDLWERRFAELLAFQQRHGHTRVTKTWPGHRVLAHWRHNQCAFRRRGLLSPERIHRLDAIGFQW